MGKPRAPRRDGFTPSGSGAPLDAEYESVEAPRFVAKYRNPPYLNPRVVKGQKKGPEGDA